MELSVSFLVFCDSCRRQVHATRVANSHSFAMIYVQPHDCQGGVLYDLGSDKSLAQMANLSPKEKAHEDAREAEISSVEIL